MLLTFLMLFTSKMYWFTRLSAITTALETILIISGILAGAVLILWVIVYLSDPEYIPDGEESKRRFLKIGTKTLCISIIIFVIGLIGKTFIPTTSEALVIYGVGESVEYLQYNKDAVQIPDKALQALNKYLDEAIGDKENSN
mgnify:FL=1